MKKKISIALVGIFGSLLLMGDLVQAQIKAPDAAKMAEAAIGIGLKIDDSCQKKKKNLEKGFQACKAGICAPAKCISFRTRCENGECN